MSRTFLLAVLLASTPALASSGKGNAFGPYDVNPGYTTGHAEGFRQLFVDPARLGELIAPTEALADAADDVLHVQNRTSAWTELTVSGVRVGIVGPLATVTLRNLKPGAYETLTVGPTGLAMSRTVTSARYDAIKQAEAQAAAAAAEQQAQQEALDQATQDGGEPTAE